MKNNLQKIVNKLLVYDGGKYFNKFPIVKEDPKTHRRYIADPTAFFLAVLLDMGMPAEYVWRKAPHELRRRLGHLDVVKIAGMSPKKFEKIFGQQPVIHRYKKNMAGWVQDACRRIVARYGGNPENIWNDAPSPEDLERRFREFKGFGQKKSSMAVNIMIRDGLVPLRIGKGIDVSVDVQTRRVFFRTGLVKTDSSEAILAAARRLIPDNPGALDRPAWLVGREYCFPQGPDCPKCPLNIVCGKNILSQQQCDVKRKSNQNIFWNKKLNKSGHVRDELVYDGVVNKFGESQKMGKDTKSIKEVRREFWREFLTVANQITDLYQDTTPTVNDWIQASAGKPGIVYTCKVRQYATQVMVNIDNRPANDEKEVFNRLRRNQREIEKTFGESLIWDQKEGRRIHRIRKLIEVGGYEDPQKWPYVSTITIETMLRLKDAIAPFINSLPMQLI